MLVNNINFGVFPNGNLGYLATINGDALDDT